MDAAHASQHPLPASVSRCWPSNSGVRNSSEMAWNSGGMACDRQGPMKGPASGLASDLFPPSAHSCPSREKKPMGPRWNQNPWATHQRAAPGRLDRGRRRRQQWINRGTQAIRRWCCRLEGRAEAGGLALFGACAVRDLRGCKDTKYVEVLIASRHKKDKIIGIGIANLSWH
jgi:hypothetical protein